MTIYEAIAKAKEDREWSYTRHDPFTVAVGFINDEGRDDETCFDLYGDDPERELNDLWNDMAYEFGSKLDSITYVESHGYGWEG